MERSIGSENLRKLLPGDDSGATSGDVAKVADALAHAIYGRKQKIRSGKILEDHGLYAPYSMANNPRFELTLAPVASLLVAQGGETMTTYRTDNIQHEYEVAENSELPREISQGYAVGRSLGYEHVTLLKTETWAGGDTLHNVTVIVPGESTKAIALLWTRADRADSEDYAYPFACRYFEEAWRLFGGDSETCATTLASFFRNRFGLVVDLRSHADARAMNAGKRLGQLAKQRAVGNGEASHLGGPGLPRFCRERRPLELRQQRSAKHPVLTNGPAF